MNSDEKKAAESNQEFHLRMKEKSREIKEYDKNAAIDSNGSIVSAVYDFQKILNTPTANVSVFYYSRKFSTYNFTIYDLATRDGICYVWDETIAKKGADEVCSCLLKFILAKVAAGATEFRFFSDNCGGQNRNRFVFGFYAFCANKFKIKITHTFLEKGHTQNEGDSIHATIERASKNQLVFVPSQWYSIMRGAKKTQNPYRVIEMDQSDFFDFKEFVSKTYWAKNDDGEKTSWSSVRQLMVLRDSPHQILYRNDLSESVAFTPITTQKRRMTRKGNNSAVDPFAVNAPIKYLKSLPVNTSEKQDILKLCDGGHPNGLPLVL